MAKVRNINQRKRFTLELYKHIFINAKVCKRHFNDLKPAFDYVDRMFVEQMKESYRDDIRLTGISTRRSLIDDGVEFKWAIIGSLHFTDKTTAEYKLATITDHHMSYYA